MIPRIIFALVVIQGLLFLVHLFVFRSLVRFFGIQNLTAINWLRAVFFLLSISFLVASVIGFRYYGSAVSAIYRPAAVWLGTLYWLFWASILGRLVLDFVFASRPATGLLVAKILVGIAVLVSAYGVYHSYQTKVKKVTVRLPNLPANWSGRKVLLFSDTHFGHMRGAAFAKKLADLASQQDADVVLIPGDFYDGTPADYAASALEMGKIRSRYGIYFSLGNHEEFRNHEIYTKPMTEAGINVLINKKVDIDGLQIVGLDYLISRTAQGEADLLERMDLDSSRASILLKHVPSNIPVAQAAGISLQVSGHTHYGQVFPLGWITGKVYSGFHAGLKRLGATQVYTTSGAGTWGPPQRVGSDSEMVLMTLERE